MPELPEVETIKRGLERLTLKKKIVRVHVLCEKSWRGYDAERVLEQKIVKFDRRGKALLICLSNGLWMMVHLRMTGQMIYTGAEKFAAGHPDGNFTAEMPSKHTRVYFDFDDGSHLFFNDQRKFGFIKLLDELGLQEEEFLCKLAPEPWDMTKDEFWARLQKHPKSLLKAVLLDQHVIAGVGNIYADEACFWARIYPGVRVSEVSREVSDKLLDGICKVMQASIDSGGSTMKDYVRADGTKGSYLEKFAQVFRRDGDACRVCGSKILKTRVAGRGTHYCPECQA